MKRTVLIAATLLWAAAAFASWYDDYDAGIEAIRKGNWSAAIQKMTAAINSNGKEGDKTRTYGAIFINYHPYYYRGVAYLNSGKYQQAISDFEKTSGPGEENLGTLEELMRRAKTKLAESTAPPPTTDTVVTKPPVTNTVVQPVVPSLDNALRTRARAALDQAKTHIQSAQERKATASPEYANALKAYTDANTRLATAKSNDDLNAVVAAADNITLLADSAQAATVAIVTPPVTTTHPTKAGGATDIALADTRNRLRRALQLYFDGEFGDAAHQFESLTRDMPNNAWIWAFLGASQYSQYAFEGEQSYKESAMESFKRAKTYGKWKDGSLPDKYFSRKIRKAFKETAG